MILYGIKTCDTCRKALKSLEAAGREVRFVDIRAEPLEPAKIAQFLAAFGPALVNTRSTTWREMSDDARVQPAAEQLAENPTLMKRPVIEADSLHLGWGKDVQSVFL